MLAGIRSFSLKQLLSWSMGSRVYRLLQLHHVGSIAAVSWLESSSSVAVVHSYFIALQHVGSFQARDRTCVPSMGRQILNHWTTGKPL